MNNFNCFLGTTRIDHDIVGQRQVSRCQERGCSVHYVTYENSMSQIGALATLSKSCEQHVRVSVLSYSIWGPSSGSSTWEFLK